MDADLASWQSVGVALALGLLIGAERERSKHELGSPGIRTFALIGLLGGLSAHLPRALAVTAAAGVVLLVVTSYVGSLRQDAGMTSEVSALTTFALGALTETHAALAVSGAVVVTVLLASKERMHHFVRDTITEQEIADALRFFVAAFIVLPLLPDRPVGPYGVLVPQRLWVLVVLITAIGWVGHVGTRVLGARYGLMLAGLAGGFVSGTATTGVMAARSRAGAAPRSAAMAGALLASVATLVQLVVVTSFVAPGVARRLVVPAVLGALVLIGEAWWLFRRSATRASDGAEHSPRPLALGPAIVLAAVITSVLLLAAWMDDRFGGAGAVVATATGALADLHAAAVAVATLAKDGVVSEAVAGQAIGLGLLTNTLGKLVAAWVGGGPAFARDLFLALLPAVVVVGAALAF